MTDDRARVAELLGRPPRGDFEVVVRDAGGDPVVIRNAPLLDDGTPMPTRYWLVGPGCGWRSTGSRPSGGVRAAEAAVDPDGAGRRPTAATRPSGTPPSRPAWTGPRPAAGSAAPGRA